MKGKELVEQMVERAQALNVPSDAVLASQQEEVTFTQSEPSEDISVEAPPPKPSVKVRDEGILDEMMSSDSGLNEKTVIEVPSGMDDSVISC